MSGKSKDFYLGVVIGINLSIEKTFKKIVQEMRNEAVAKHDAICNIQDDVDHVEELLLVQKEYVEKIVEGGEIEDGDIWKTLKKFIGQEMTVEKKND